ncbi:MAG: S8 family serine peptidase [Hymenobacteraceae bacterium]|nr:S8 family serine peptidase [Hymenobacteraceae bacterium]
MVDTGIRSSHADMGSNTLNPAVAGGWNFGNNVPLSTYPNGDGHGTAVAGIIGARCNNSLGVAGIAGGDNTLGAGVRLYDMTVLQRFPNSPVTVIPASAVASAVVEGAMGWVRSTYGNKLWVINISLGSANRSLGHAVRTCYQNSVVLTASRGNSGDAASGNPLSYPACFPDEWVMSVSACGTDGQIKRPGTGGPLDPTDNNYTSSYGAGIDVMAPGTKRLIRTTGNASNSSYVGFNGTSPAAPHVAGVASLLLSYHNPTAAMAGLEAEDVEQIIQRTASDREKDINNVTLPRGYDYYSRWGLLDANKALGFIDQYTYQIDHTYGVLTPATRGTLPPGCTLTLVAANQTLELDEPYDGVYLRSYGVDVYRLTATFPYQRSSNLAAEILNA